MSLENEDIISDYETSGIADKPSKILYAREFLLSLSELEICKKLPSGFDPSILSEFEDAFHGAQERQRAPVGFQLQGYKRSEYNSSLPTRGDSGSYSRSSYGRWDTRSSGRSDQDSDSNSDPGRNRANPSRRPWQSSEHDGLLGSGSFSRPGYGSCNSSLKSRVTDDDKNNPNDVPYHPPRPYKAAPYSRRETKDSYNDETFGSSESASEDKVEEERQRRASFELARKEQHKVLQEKQKLNEKQKVNAGSGISEILEDMKEKRDLEGSYMSHESATGAIPVNDSIKSSQTTTFRPLVPPGFANAIGEKNFSLKPLVHTHKIEIANSKPEELPLHSQLRSCGTLNTLERQSSQEHSFGDNRLDDRSTHTILLDKGTKIGSSLSFGVSEPDLTVGDNFFRTSSVVETCDSFEGPEVIEVIPEVSGSEVLGEFNKRQTPSILDKFFGSTLPIDTSSPTSLAKHSNGKPDDIWNPSSIQSSKCANWFLEEERKPGEHLTYGMPNDLLPLIVSGDKSICQPSGEKYMGHFPSGNSQKSSDFASDLMIGLSSKSNDIVNHQCESSKTEAIPSVLTCEDLEQAILSECSDKRVSLPLKEQLVQYSSVTDKKSEQSRPVDNHASQHLLSLLHKDSGLSKMQLRPATEIPMNDVAPSDQCDTQDALGETSKEGLKSDPVSSTPTLEALFGNAFMRELQSAEGPVSVRRGSVESAQTDAPEDLGLQIPLINRGSTRVGINEDGQKSPSQMGDGLPLNHVKESRSESWLGISDSQDEPDFLKSLIGLNSRHSDPLELDRFQLSEKERLISNDHPLNHRNLMFEPAETSRIVPESSPFVHGPYNNIEPWVPHRNLYAHPSSSQFQNQPMSHERPWPFALDSHSARMNSHMKFIGPESMTHRDPLANHQLTANMFRPHFPHPGAGVTGVNVGSHDPILQQMQTSGNHPPQLLHRYQSNVLPHPGNQPNALIPELNSTQGFPFGPQRPHNMSSSGLQIPALNVNNGSNHPEALQRLLEMEHREKSKQIHPPPPGHSQAMYNNELDVGFRYN